MYELPEQPVSDAFAACWRAAAVHLHERGDGALAWLKADLNPPMLAHIAFRIGNQLIFIHVEDVDGHVHGPASLEGLERMARLNRGIACLMPMKRHGGEWRPAEPGWGLLDARTGGSVDPAALVSDELIEMTEWELQDFAVQVVRDSLERESRDIISSNGDPEVDPSIWFVGKDGPEWVVVRASRYPAPLPEPPANLDAIAAICARFSRIGHFAPVGVASGVDPFDGANPSPLWRGHGMVVRYAGFRDPQF